MVPSSAKGITAKPNFSKENPRMKKIEKNRIRIISLYEWVYSAPIFFLKFNVLTVYCNCVLLYLKFSKDKKFI